MSISEDPTVIRRQMTCKHAFIKPPPAADEICVHCGVSGVDWTALQIKQALTFPWGGVP